MLKTLRLASRLLWRECRAGEWLIIGLALMTAVAALTGLHFYTDRIDRALQHQSAALLGGDLVINSPTPIPAEWREQATLLGLRYADVWSYPSVVSTNNQLQLVNISAVSDTYPLMNHHPLRPARQTIWVEGRLLPLLSLKIKDNLTIGSASLRIARTLPADLEALSTGWLIAPRVLMLIDDVPATKTVIRGSRVNYQLLLTGNASSLQSFRQWINPQLSAGQKLIDVHNQRSPLRETLQQTADYLHLLLLACLMMSGVAIAISVRQYLQRHYAHIALWRCLGSRESTILHIIIIQFGMIAIICGLIGSLTGYVFQLGLSQLFQSELRLILPPASAYPILTGIIISTLLLFGFAYPVVNELPKTPPLMLWRNEINRQVTRDYFYPLLSLAAIITFIIIFIGFSLTMLFYTAAMLFSIVMLYLFSIITLSLLRYLANCCDGILRHGLNQMIRHPATVSIQLTGFTLILASLLTLGLIRTQVMDHWQSSLPPETPNYFAMNMAPSDVNNVQSFFNRNHINIEKIDPIVRGRLVSLNNQPILDAVPKDAQNNNALHRELNLSWMQNFPSDNSVVSGVSWQSSDHGKALVSVEKNVGEELGFKLGDQLQFQVGDQTFTAEIHSFRTLNWSSFHPNFYMIFPPGVIDHYPATYITSFYLPPDKTILLNQLVSQFPNITIIDMAAILSQVRQIVDKATLAIKLIFGFLAIIAMLIFIVSLQATLDERRQTYRMMHTLGASNKYIYKLIAIEASTLTIVILLSSILIASVVTLYISNSMIQF